VRIAASVFAEIREKGVVTRGWIGAEYGDAPVMPGALGIDGPRGVALTGVYAGGPAHTAGLRAGDLVLELNGEPVVDRASLRAREAAMAPGTRVKLAGLRAGVPFEVELELAQRPPG
jgi:serine protease DegQ